MFIKMVVPIRGFAGRWWGWFLQVLSYHGPDLEWEFFHLDTIVCWSPLAKSDREEENA
jgi:hypothetical protein